MSKKTKATLMALVGVLSIILAIMCFSADPGFHGSYERYGGDAYTGIQNTAARAVDNIRNLTRITKTGFGSVLLITGCCLIISSIPIKEGRKEKQNGLGLSAQSAQDIPVNNNNQDNCTENTVFEARNAEDYNKKDGTTR